MILPIGPDVYIEYKEPIKYHEHSNGSDNQGKEEIRQGDGIILGFEHIGCATNSLEKVPET